MNNLEYTINQLDRFFEIFFDDSIYIYGIKTIDSVIHMASKGTLKVTNAAMIDILELWQDEGRLKIGNNDLEYVTLNQEYWARRTGRRAN